MKRTSLGAQSTGASLPQRSGVRCSPFSTVTPPKSALKESQMFLDAVQAID